MAFVSSLSGCSVSTLRSDTDTGIRPDTSTPDTTVLHDTSRDNTVLRDTNVADALTCADCLCPQWPGAEAGTRPNCDNVGLASCCYAVGPLAPPDVPA